MKPDSQPAVAGQERRQAAERRIDEPIGAPLADRRQRHDRGGEQVGGDGDRRAVKVAAGHDVAGVGEDHRVVGGAVGLDVDRLAHEAAARRAPRRAPGPRTAASRRPAPCPQCSCECVDPAAAHQRRDVGGRHAAVRRTAAPRGSAPRTGGSTRAGRRSTARRRCRRRGRPVRPPPAPAPAPPSTAACR